MKPRVTFTRVIFSHELNKVPHYLDLGSSIMLFEVVKTNFCKFNTCPADVLICAYKHPPLCDV